MRVHVGETALIAKRLGQRLGFSAQAQYFVEASELETGRAEVETEIDGLASPVETFRQSLQHLESALETLDRLAVGAQGRGLAPRGLMIVHGPRPLLRASEVPR